MNDEPATVTVDETNPPRVRPLNDPEAGERFLAVATADYDAAMTGIIQQQGLPPTAPETFDLPTAGHDDAAPDLVSADGDTQLEVKEPVAEPRVKKSFGRGRLNSNERVRKSTAHGTTIHPVPAKKPRRDRLAETGKFATAQLRAFKSLLALGATEPGLGVTLKALAKHAKVSANGLRRGIGPTDKKTTAAHEKRYGYRCLISRGMVKFTHDEEQGTCYHLTALGNKKAEQARDAGELKLGKPRRGV